MAGLKKAKRRGASVDSGKSKMPRVSLEQQLENETIASGKSHRSGKSRTKQENEDYVDAAMSNKILREARKQQQEIQKERDEEDDSRKAFAALADVKDYESDSEDDGDEDKLFDSKSEYDPTEEISEEEERILSLFMAKDAGPQRTLTDLIMEKIKTTDLAIENAEEGRTIPGVDKKVIEVYRGVGKLLSRYTAGKLPKAFKIVVALSNWEEILYLTEPENWSPNAVYQATRLFASNLNSRMAQKFYTLVLLPRVREDIRVNKRLHFALYQALKKSVYKPAAFYKGILFPLCQSGTCNLREAVIIGSIIQRVSIPAPHSSVAILKIAEMEYSGTNSYFMKLILDKKYALPYRVVDAVVLHFLKFMDEERTLPVIWHQCLLTFVQRYKNSLTEANKEDLKRLMRRQKHYLVTPEVQRELQHSLNRGQKEEDVKPMVVVNGTTGEDIWDLPKVEVEMEE